MADASNVQTDFRGGEWSQAAQGRMDDREYRRALNSCYNAYPTEAGQWNRRQGTRFVAHTLSGQFAQLITFAFSDTAPYVMELTNNAIRFYSGITLVMTDTQPIVSISTANPAVMTTQAAVTWATGDTVQFLAANGADVSGCGVLFNRQFVVTKVTTTTFSLADAITSNSLDGSTFTAPATGLSVGRILELSTTYAEDDLTNIRYVQTEQLTNNVLFGQVVLLHNSYAPQLVSATTEDTADAFAQFGISQASFVDGPYFDPVNGSVSASATSGTITLSSAPANTFASTDVGRHVRLFSEPAAWASGTGYVTGNSVKYSDGNYYTALASSTGKAPNQYPTLWSINPSAAVWAWGTIASYVSGTSVTVTLPATWPDGTTNALLYTGTINTWRLGLYSATTGYPSCGIFHEGRLWLAGSQGNRIDGSVSGQILQFSPTAPDGTVGDANAISAVFNSDDVNKILWLTPEHQGIVAGTAGGEWLIQASALSDPLTPFSVQAKRQSKYKCANVPAVRVPFANMVVQAQQKRLIEYMADLFSGRYLGRNMSEKALHLTTAGISRLAYQQDLCPIVWTLKQDGSLAGLTYKRESSFSSEPPVFAGWHRHQLGIPNSTVESIAVGPSIDGTLESLFLSVLDPRTGLRHVEMLTDMFLETNEIEQAWFLDGALPASAVKVNTAQTQMTLYGFTPYIGQTISIWGMGLDLGDYTVAADGSVTLTFGTPALFTLAKLQSYISSTPQSAWDTRVFLPQTVTYNGSGTTIQSYQNAAPVTGAQTGGFLDYRDGNIVATISAGNGSTNGICTFNRLTGALLQSVSITTILNNAIHASSNNISAGTGPTLDPDGNIYFPSDLSNSTCIRKVSLSTLELTGSFGVPGSGIAQATSTTMFSPRALVGSRIWVPPKKNSTRDNKWTNLVFLTALLGDWWAILNGDTMTLLATGSVTEARSNVCAGQVLANQANATSFTNFHLVSVSATSGNIAPLGVYTVTVLGADKHLTNSPTQTKAGTIAASAIDATWTTIESLAGPFYDATDGNIIIMVSTTDAVTNKQYVVKVNPFTAGIVWATAVTTLGNGGGAAINFGTFAYMNGISTIISVATSNGAVTTTFLNGISDTGPTVSDDYDGSVFYKGNYTSGGGAPTPLNGTVSANGLWFRLQGTVTGQVTAAAQFTLPSVPFIGGYTYTSQGQRVRPAEPADSGSRNGPAFGKNRRNNKAAFQLVQAQGISIGTQFVDLTKVRVLELKSDRVNINAANVLFSGVARQEVDDDYTYDGMLAWQITRPYPCIVTAVGGFLHTQDI